ncbi:MAG: hypothetical protein NTX53_20855 [candidate division WOR-3 bacterium]|nr:hypothetical protein [candidate division WOR-3 bacterium]
MARRPSDDHPKMRRCALTAMASVAILVSINCGSEQPPKADPNSIYVGGEVKHVVGGASYVRELKRLASNASWVEEINYGNDQDNLLAALEHYGNQHMAGDFLHCGNPALADAARSWAAKHGIAADALPTSGMACRWDSK